MNSEKRKQTSVRFEQDFYDEVESYRKAHGINTWVKALHSRERENLQRIKEQEARIVELEKAPKSVLSYLDEKGFSKNGTLEHEETNAGQVAGRDSMEFSDITCKALGHDKNGKPFCIDPNAPISTQARRHFNWEVCRFCQKMKNAEHEKLQREQKEKMKQARERQQREISRLQKSVNDTIAKQKASKRSRPFTNEYGERIEP